MKILVAKGKKLVEFEGVQAKRFEVLQIALGRSGTLRAPTIKIGDTWLVGFNEEAYRNILE